jgi:ribosome-binding protein aMBF1 (putative translation factor)
MPEEKHLTHITRPMTPEERAQAATIRERVMQEFPPKESQENPAPPGIPSRIQNARVQKRITRYELGQLANVPSTVVRAIEQGEDVPMSQFHAVAAALGLVIELVEQASA